MISENLKELSLLFKQNETPLYLVGGFVRDEILGIKTDDIDVASKADAQCVINFCKRKFVVCQASKKLGTLIIKKPNFIAEYTPFRNEEYLSCTEHRPNKVWFNVDLKQDAYRRDFTVNCIYKDVLTGKIIDTYGGIKDIKNKTIKQIHNKVFDVDPLRILRMVRFAVTHNFKIDKRTFLNAKRKASNVKFLSKDRIREEFNKILQSDRAVYGVKLLQELGIIKNEKLINFKFDNNLTSLCADLFYDDKDKDELVSFLSTFAKNNNQKEEVIKSLEFAKQFDLYNNVLTFINNEKYLFNASLIVKDTISFVKCLDEIIEKKLPLSIGQLDVNGNDLIKLGIDEKKIGKMLKYLLVEVVRDGLENEKEKLITKIKEKIK